MKPSLVEIVLRKRAEQRLARISGSIQHCLVCGRKLNAEATVDVCMTCRLEHRRLVLAEDGSAVDYEDEGDQ